MRAEEICTHYSEDPSRFAGAVTPPIFQSSLFTECEGRALCLYEGVQSHHGDCGK